VKVGDLVKYITTNDYGIILDKEYACEETYKVYWFNGSPLITFSALDWWDGGDLEVISESR
jgi:hypothetical protein